MSLSLIVAVAENNVIGYQGDLPWHLSTDLRRFNRLTMGHTMLMGRKTWESIGRPLPGRISIVISHQADYATGFQEVPTALNLDEAMSLAHSTPVETPEVFVIGGAGIYEMLLPRADRLLLTRVHAKAQGDAFFPQVNWTAWKLLEEEKHPADDKNDFPHTYQVYERKVE